MNKVPMTVRGAELLREELKKLKSDDRPKVIQAIAEARAHGDLKENAEYHAAKDQQGFIEARIKEVEANVNLDKSSKGKLTNAYRTAISNLELSASYQKTAEEFLKSKSTAPEQTKARRYERG